MQGTSGPPRRLSDNEAIEAGNRLILSHLETALRYGRYFAARTHLFADAEEVTSLAYMALCEAARRFHPDRNTRFSTYLFFHVRRVLFAVARKGRSDITFLSWEGLPEGTVCAGVHDREHACPCANTPERAFGVLQERENLWRALARLDPMEREIIRQYYFQDRHLTAVASEMRMSRMHLYTLRERALRKLRQSQGIVRKPAAARRNRNSPGGTG